MKNGVRDLKKMPPGEAEAELRLELVKPDCDVARARCSGRGIVVSASGGRTRVAISLNP